MAKCAVIGCTNEATRGAYCEFDAPLWVLMKALDVLPEDWVKPLPQSVRRLRTTEIEKLIQQKTTVDKRVRLKKRR